jgi:1-phosphofructokinase family hexose kinase
MTILTLTVNASIDHILQTERIQLHEKNILTSHHSFIGGKGINVAYSLGKLGIPTIACGLIGKDAISDLTEKFREFDIKVQFTTTHSTRHTFKLTDKFEGDDTEFNQPGITIAPEQFEQLFTILQNSMDGIHWLVLSGSVPPGIPVNIYADLIEQYHHNNVFILLDTSGFALEKGMQAKPTMLRINHSECAELFPACNHTPAEIRNIVHNIHQKGIKYCVISYGSEGAIGSDGDIIWKVKVPRVKPRSLTGAGDAMTAGLVSSLSKGITFKDSLIFSSALATASTLQLEPGDFLQRDLDQFLQETTIEIFD